MKDIASAMLPELSLDVVAAGVVVADGVVADEAVLFCAAAALVVPVFVEPPEAFDGSFCPALAGCAVLVAGIVVVVGAV